MGKKKAAQKDDIKDWISNLASSAVEATVPTKAERVERRNAKKRRRQEKRAPTMRDVRARPSEPDMFSSISQSQQQQQQQQQNSRRLVELLSRQVEQCLQNQQERWPKPYTAVESKIKLKNTNSVQPCKNDYGGIGLARPSLWISLDDPSWRPKLEQEFAEHIEGFFGKQRTKSMKKQLNGNMLWKKLQSNDNSTKINGKRIADMSPNEKVEAMLKSGII